MSEQQPESIRDERIDGQYVTRRPEHDEAYAENGALRPEWARLLTRLDALGASDLERRRTEGRRLLRETGLSFVLGGDGPHWDLDPVPYLISSDDWRMIEAGLRQRARLLDMILRDVYGPRRLIALDLLPPALVYRHQGFLRACDRTLSTDPALVLYAADIGRGPDGRMRIVSDRTESPSGAGYALEARIVCSRIMPQLISESRVRRLAGFFRSLRRSLFLQAPHQKVDPRIVVLSRGDEETAYFDHAYLASYLGYGLVRAQDLTAREGHLWLKTIEGLKLVDIVVRRLTDRACDPLELDPQSDGVPGLLEVARRGNVVLANPLGAGFLENPGLLAVLPEIARRLIGEDLLLDSAKTWWCGRGPDREFVLDNMDRLVIKGINRGDGVFFGPAMSWFELTRLRNAIHRDPELYVGQENMGYVTTPALRDGMLSPHYALTRCFVTTSDGNHVVLPGGFTRVVPDGNLSEGVARAKGGICKDTWVLADDAAPADVDVVDPELVADVGVPLDESLPSRAAESIYWVGRHAERAESLARLTRTVLKHWHETRDYADPGDEAAVGVLDRAIRQVSGYEPNHADTRALLGAQLTDADQPGTVAGAIRRLEDAVTSVRERWSGDVWRVIDDLSEDLERAQRDLADGAREFETTLDRMVTGLVALTGLTMESMLHGDSWRFLVIGRRIERSFWLVRLLRSTLEVALAPPAENGVLEAVLVANESLMIHRRRYRSSLSVAAVLELLVRSPDHPRSLAFQIDGIKRGLEELPRRRGARDMTTEERAILEASTRIRLADPNALTVADPDGSRYALTAFLAEIEANLDEATRGLSHSYFIHVQPARQLAALVEETDE